jgi:hypothetical protein
MKKLWRKFLCGAGFHVWYFYLNDKNWLRMGHNELKWIQWCKYCGKERR